MKYKIKRGKSLFLAYVLHEWYVSPEPTICIKKDSIPWYVYGEDGKSYGFASARELNGDILYLNSAAVVPEARGNGLQKRLIRCRARYADKHDLTAITYTTPDNSASINNLVSCGFRAYQPEYPWVGKQYCYWRRDK